MGKYTNYFIAFGELFLLNSACGHVQQTFTVDKCVLKSVTHRCHDAVTPAATRAVCKGRLELLLAALLGASANLTAAHSSRNACTFPVRGHHFLKVLTLHSPLSQALAIGCGSGNSNSGGMWGLRNIIHVCVLKSQTQCGLQGHSLRTQTSEQALGFLCVYLLN